MPPSLKLLLAILAIAISTEKLRADAQLSTTICPMMRYPFSNT